MDKRKNTAEQENALQKNIGEKKSIVCLIFEVGHADGVSDLSVCRTASNDADRTGSDLLDNAWQPYLAKYP